MLGLPFRDPTQVGLCKCPERRLFKLPGAIGQTT
jgi:hypothetical protein